LDNYRAALEWATGEVNPQPSTLDRQEAALRLVVALWRYWYRRGLLSEGRSHLQAVLRVAGEPHEERSRGLWAEALAADGVLADNLGDYADAQRLAEQSLALARARGDRAGEA